MNKRHLHQWLSSLVVLVLLVGCGGGTQPPAPVSSPPVSGGAPEPPGDPDINLGLGGFTLDGNAPVIAGNSLGSAAFGTISSFKLSLTTPPSRIDVTSVTIAFSSGALTISKGSGNVIAWSLGGNSLTLCPDACNAYTLPTGLQNITTTAGTNFSYTASGSTTSVSAPLSSFGSVEVKFQ